MKIGGFNLDEEEMEEITSVLTEHMDKHGHIGTLALISEMWSGDKRAYATFEYGFDLGIESEKGEWKEED